MSTENKRLMQHVFDELAKGNGQPFMECMADDVSWRVTGTTKFSRTYEGKQSIRDDLVGPLFSKLADQYTNTADRFIAEGDYVVVESNGKANTKSGVPYNNKYCWVFRFEDGKIKELTEYMDTHLVVTALGG